MLASGHSAWDWVAGGVNLSQDATGGDECLHYSTALQRNLEAAMFIGIAVAEIAYSLRYVARSTLYQYHHSVYLHFSRHYRCQLGGGISGRRR